MYDRQATGYRDYLKLESMLINGKIDIDFVKRYPEFQNDSLMVQVGMFKQTTNASITTRITWLTNTGELSTCNLKMLQRCHICVVLVFE